jgi:hypothetical protein
MGTTRSPGRMRVTLEPTASTSPTPSWPGTPGSSGAMGYLPSMVFMSEGLMGACRGNGQWSKATERMRSQHRRRKAWQLLINGATLIWGSGRHVASKPRHRSRQGDEARSEEMSSSAFARRLRWKADQHQHIHGRAAEGVVILTAKRWMRTSWSPSVAGKSVCCSRSTRSGLPCSAKLSAVAFACVAYPHRAAIEAGANQAAYVAHNGVAAGRTLASMAATAAGL